MKRAIILALSLFSITLSAQESITENKKLDFLGDFRFRVEQDWGAQNAMGQAISDRSRLRYRFRFGLKYSIDKHSSIGARIRSGNINDQQGPHLTIGGNTGEFGLAQIGFEKLFYQFKNKNFKAWIGKNDIPLFKLNELFWNDNVFVEGLALRYNSDADKEKFINQYQVNAGHFIIQSNNLSFNKDSYLQLLQLNFKIRDRINFFPAFYRFKEIGNFPDKKNTFDLDYSLLHLGLSSKIGSNAKLGIEYYQNFENYKVLKSVPDNLKDQKQGWVVSAKYGDISEKGNWQFHLYYAYIQKYAIVDYFAQNDWVRWDYSSIDAAGSRISNFQGVELRIGYAIKKNMNLILRAYVVEQLVAEGLVKENGNRARIDFNVSF